MRANTILHLITNRTNTMTTLIKQQTIEIIDQELVIRSAAQLGQSIGHGSNWTPSNLTEAVQLLEDLGKKPTKANGYTVSNTGTIVDQKQNTENNLEYFELYDESEGDTISGYIDKKSNLGIGIHFDGYGDCCSDDNCGTPVYIEKYDNEVRVRVYSEINSEEATHNVSLKEAKLDKRKTE